MSDVSSGVIKRTIFTTQLPVVNGQPSGEKVYRFAEFASVVTTIGQCWETFSVNDIYAFSGQIPSSYDPKDMMRRIDNIETFGPKESAKLMSNGNGQPLHCLDQWLRVGP